MGLARAAVVADPAPSPSPVHEQPPLDDNRPAGRSDPLAAAEDLRSFLASAGTLTLGERRTIVEQALVLIEQNYVHLLWVPVIRSWPLTSTYAYLQLTLKAAPRGPKSVLKVSSDGCGRSAKPPVRPCGRISGTHSRGARRRSQALDIAPASPPCDPTTSAPTVRPVATAHCHPGRHRYAPRSALALRRRPLDTGALSMRQVSA